MTLAEDAPKRVIQHKQLRHDQSLADAIVTNAREQGITVNDWGKGVLIRKFDISRIPLVLQTGTDRDSTSDITRGQYGHQWEIAQELGLGPEDVILLADEVMIIDQRYTPDLGIGVYNPTVLQTIPGTIFYTPQPRRSFSDALVAIFSREAPPNAEELSPAGSIA